MNLQPTKCNLCGGNVVYISNAKIYGKQYGSGYCYCCMNCGAYVGTHKGRPKEAFGILANPYMRQKKRDCHNIFDTLWKNAKQRRACYGRLAKALNIDVSECHFGYFDTDMLNKAYEILKKWRADG